MYLEKPKHLIIWNGVSTIYSLYYELHCPCTVAMVYPKSHASHATLSKMEILITKQKGAGKQIYVDKLFFEIKYVDNLSRQKITSTDPM